MKKVAAKIKAWPFDKGEKAKLIWIGEPFKENNKWMFYTYFKGSKATRKILLDWASVHFLSVDKYYIDGNLNNGEIAANTEVVDINLNGIKAQYIEKDWEIWGSGFKDKTKSKTFNFNKYGKLYTIPIIEIIRAILAPDAFTLNRIVEMNTLENYFTYKINSKNLDIHFTSLYDKGLLKEEKVNHLSWVLTNPKVFKIFNSIGENLWELGELNFDFLLDKFNIKARVSKNERYTMIKEIISLRKKRINVNEVNVFHPSLEESQATNQAKKRKYVGNNKDGEREINSDVDGSTNSTEEISTLLISHEYEKLPKINRVKSGRKVRRKEEDENTKLFIIENGQDRTVADVGGENLLKVLEFISISNIQEKGELEEFVEILKLLEKRPAIKSVEIIIGDLPEGKRGKRFSKLSDGITRRKYAIGKVIMEDDRECSLVEIQREKKSLSMLILKANSNVTWNLAYSKLLLGLVNESGKWSNRIIEELYTEGIAVCRITHIKRSVYEIVRQIYGKIML